MQPIKEISVFVQRESKQVHQFQRIFDGYK